MPHITFDSGDRPATADWGGRQIIPGIQPGGSRVGHPTKPAMLIKRVWVELIDFTVASADNLYTESIYLKLSKNKSLNPGLLLLVAQVTALSSSTANETHQGVNIKQHGDRLAGLVFTPAYMGIRFVEHSGNWSGFNLDVHFEYEQVDVPWMDWFMHWEFIDNVVNNERQF